MTATLGDTSPENEAAPAGETGDSQQQGNNNSDDDTECAATFAEMRAALYLPDENVAIVHAHGDGPADPRGRPGRRRRRGACVMSATPYQVMPPLTADERAQLQASIAEVGVLVPITVDEDGVIIDGHHRKEIAEQLGIDYPVQVITGLDDNAKRAMAYELNLNRRHLTRAQKRELVTESLKIDPQLSDREHAKRTGVTHPTVAAIRSAMVSSGQVESFTTRVGANGVEQSFRPAGPGGKFYHLFTTIPATIEELGNRLAEMEDEMSQIVSAAKDMGATDEQIRELVVP